MEIIKIKPSGLYEKIYMQFSFKWAKLTRDVSGYYLKFQSN